MLVVSMYILLGARCSVAAVGVPSEELEAEVGSHGSYSWRIWVEDQSGGKAYEVEAISGNGQRSQVTVGRIDVVRQALVIDRLADRGAGEADHTVADVTTGFQVSMKISSSGRDGIVVDVTWSLEVPVNVMRDVGVDRMTRSVTSHFRTKVGSPIKLAKTSGSNQPMMTVYLEVHRVQ